MYLGHKDTALEDATVDELSRIRSYLMCAPPMSKEESLLAKVAGLEDRMAALEELNKRGQNS